MRDPYYSDDLVTVYHAKCAELMAELPADSIDAIVTDPPYGLEFMGKEWDRFASKSAPSTAGRTGSDKAANAAGFAQASIGAKLPSYGGQRPTTSRCLACGKRDQFRNPHACGADARWIKEPIDPHSAPPAMVAFQQWCEEWAAEAYRVLKPGGHLLAFGGARTWHRLTVAVENVGFEIRDNIAWLYASGFPKSMDVATAIDTANDTPGTFGEPKTEAHAGWIERGKMRGDDGHAGWQSPWMDDPEAVDRNARRYIPGSPEAEAWQGWGTALKPAFEPVVVARKPLAGTVAATVLEHGTGALNIDACRTPFTEGEALWSPSGTESPPSTVLDGGASGALNVSMSEPHGSGRWPTNLVLGHAEACDPAGFCVDGCPVAELNQQTGTLTSGGTPPRRPGDEGTDRTVYGDGWTGQDRPAGAGRSRGGGARFFPAFRFEAKAPTSERPKGDDGEGHATVKPLELMRWLVRLVTPPGGVVLDPFLGSGTTAEACLIEGVRCVGVELDPDHLPLIAARLSKPIQPTLGLDFGAA